MVDFLRISTRSKKKGQIEIYPKFICRRSKDLMIRGSDFYAIWLEDRGLWSTDEQDVTDTVDRELDNYYTENKDRFGQDIQVKVLHMWDNESGVIDSWHKYCQKQMRDSFNMLDEKLIFSNTECTKKDYASKKLEYPLEPGKCEAYDKLMSVLYTEDERRKLEWAIGAIVNGDSTKIQKFMVLYGAFGTGKSTVLNIVQMLFNGYYSVFDAKALGSSSNAFALEAFKTNPLVAIQHDGDLSHIEDNTRLNSLVSHEMMTVNEKFKSTYSNRFKAFLFMGTNKPVKITDAKSGLIRRLIDVTPSGDKVSKDEYDELFGKIKFELGAIAWHCKEVYEENKHLYDDYVPMHMLGATNDFYNFVIDNYYIFQKDDGTTLTAAWEMYKTYCEDAKVSYPFSKRIFKEELKNYFGEFKDRHTMPDGQRVRNYYQGFRFEKFENDVDNIPEPVKKKKLGFLDMKAQPSKFDKLAERYPAQYATLEGIPSRKWSQIETELKDIDTSKLHYVKIPMNHIIIDFDIPDERGDKSLERNIEEAAKWPPTYAELSKSGKGVHLHYIYTGDPEKLSRVYKDHVEIKVYTGDSSLRRMLTLCNDMDIQPISSGLPLKGEKRVVSTQRIKSEIGLRRQIERNLNKEIHGNTAPSVSMIKKILDDAYEDGIVYDVTDMERVITRFALSSHNQKDACLKMVKEMKFKSETLEENFDGETPIAFYDVEVFPNLFLVNWKLAGENNKVLRMINPEPKDIEQLIKYRLIGFNNRRYDNHILYGRLIGYDNEQLYKLSQNIIAGDSKAMFREAYNLSYTDVYDFASKKQSLKKWEIELGIHHQELGLPWDQPVTEELWDKVAEYCDNDVIATEAVFNKRQGDFTARKIQVELVKALHGINATVNDTTNTLSTKLIFGNERNPQSEFNYRDLSQPVPYTDYELYKRRFGDDYHFRVFNERGLPTYEDYTGQKLPNGYSILPFFPGYKFERGVSTYLGEEIGEGGKVFGRHGIHVNVWDGDIKSQHPHSIIAEVLFGPRYTKIFEDIVEARVAVKEHNFEKAAKMLNGVLVPYLTEEQADDLAQALKIIINSIYGLTAAKFDNPFRDKRNIDNIVAKRGALFMTLLKQQVEIRFGRMVAHIKTDSIKIPNCTPEIREWVCRFGHEFGYDFDTEAEFDRFCLVNDAVYVARFMEPKKDKKTGKDIWWTATGAQFQIPYVFKTLFSKESIEFSDLCETKAVTSSIYLDFNEQLPDVTAEEKELAKVEKALKEDPDAIELIDRAEALRKDISKGHDYKFVGKVGLFCPMQSGSGGGLLMREQKGKYYAVGGTKGYRWLESEFVKQAELEDRIDMTYYNSLVDDAIDAINNVGDFEAFVSDAPYPQYIEHPLPPDEELPF